MSEDYAVQSYNLKEYVKTAKEVKAMFEYFVLKKIDRNDNKFDGRLVKIASREISNKERIKVKVCTLTSDIAQIYTIDSTYETWIKDIIEFITDGSLLEDAIKSRQI